jgi:hypothetical protein
MLITSRRSFLRGLFAMPAIVTFANIMPVRALLLPEPEEFELIKPFLMLPTTQLARMGMETVYEEAPWIAEERTILAAAPERRLYLERRLGGIKI